MVRVGIERLHAGVDVALVHHHGILRGVENVALAPFALPSVREVVVHLNLAFLSRLCGHEHHSVCRAGTVDGSRGGVLEHLDALDVARIDIVETALDGHAVNNIQRVGVVDGAYAAHPYTRSRTGLTRRRGDSDARRQTFQRIVHTHRRGGGKLV